MKNRIDSDVIPWFGRVKAIIKVDGYQVEQKCFDTKEQAEQWCSERKEVARQEVREA